jgi:hypothetical protein
MKFSTWLAENWMHKTDELYSRRGKVSYDDFVDQLIAIMSSFTPTTQCPSPSHCAESSIADAAAVLAGTKPAAIIPANFHPETSAILKKSKQHGLAVRKYKDFIVLGQQANVNAIITLFKNKQPNAPEWRRSVGRALGYPGEAIQDFLNKIQ